MAAKSIRIGGASGYWGESAMATPQLLAAGGLDYIVYDYLAEITMSILARAHAKDPSLGYATDFITAVLRPHLPEIARQGVKVIANAGGVNPESCGAAARALVKELGLDLKVAVITGDNLAAQRDAIAKTAPADMFSGERFPDVSKVASINAYLGAFPIARALGLGADIVITGRCVDSAVTLGPCIHEFGWSTTDYDRLAAGSLAGHLIECGPQATGGNFTDWESAGDISAIGYPIAEIDSDGVFVLTKPDGTSGIVNRGAASEQLLYEIGDPQAYLLPDVAADFSAVVIEEIADNAVRVSGSKGAPPPDSLKTCVTFEDGYRAGLLVSYYGFDAAKKATSLADAAFERARRQFRKFNAGDFTETSVEIIGAESQFGAFAEIASPREVVLKIAAKHPTAMGVGLLLKEIAGLGLATPPGLSIFSGGRPKPSPVIRLFSYLTPKDEIGASIDIDGESYPIEHVSGPVFDPSSIVRPTLPTMPGEMTAGQSADDMVSIPLIKLAWARSGDKGDKANIGVIARQADYLPYIWRALSEETVAARLAHFIEGENKSARVERFFLPGPLAINFLIDAVLGGGGVASLRNDPQGKGYSQLLLACEIPVPKSIADRLL